MLDITHVPVQHPLNIIIGAGKQSYEGWIATQQEQLDLLNPADWTQSFGDRQIDALLCEHVWEHLTLEQGQAAASLCHKHLKPGGYLRCAVPDANFPDVYYQTMARGDVPPDHPAYDHKIVYDYQLFAQIFRDAGFGIDLLEYCDEQGRFHSIVN